MSKFSRSEWSKREFSREYREKADVYVLERRRLFEILKSFYRHFLHEKGRERKILDLGCGDGIVTEEIFGVDRAIRATLVDPSEDMLENARSRLENLSRVKFVKGSFQEIIDGEVPLDTYDLVVSSLAIHHLTMEEKERLFRAIYSRLVKGGYFLNIDLVLGPSEGLENWYMALWKEWIDQKREFLRIEEDIFGDIIRRYKGNDDNNPDTLDSQIEALRKAGFVEVDCYYKYGIFSIFGGKKPLEESKV
jgi:tRNA (cmo5U34)-methyltransferase